MQSTKLKVTMFFFCILSTAKKITSSINKDFGKCSSQSFSVRRELSEFRTCQFKSFQNSKYLAVAFSIYFFKVAEYRLAFKLCTCSGMCLLLNWQKLYVLLSALYMLQYVPIVIILVIIFYSKKKQKKKKSTRTPVWVKIPKLCHNTLLSIFSLGKGRESLRLKTLHKTLNTSVLSALPPAWKKI